MSFIPIKPVVEKVIDKSVEIVPVIGPGIKYVKTAQKVTKFTNPVKATTLLVCYLRYVVAKLLNMLVCLLYG